MSKATIAIGVGLVWLASTSALYLLTAAAQEPKRREKEPDDHSSSIVGAWTNEVRHAVHWSLYQPVQGARVRDSFVYFKQDGDSLTGYSLTPDHDQEIWNKEGRTDFRSVSRMVNWCSSSTLTSSTTAGGIRQRARLGFALRQI